ncbi:hypothetical protein OIN60_22110 [Paenibacillus sp. P96]|uniref:Uncharacterized protein n=1 Tax=Paenibacillus zeirhizosphaerae TaxID=2987519 RepID=A0ABT9FXQ0_9BACL|nr:hypothetical protein [Paenibacillus sp. P96]MDP4099414.1 hypothetical protein [Paenibacillus sp. P96]
MSYPNVPNITPTITIDYCDAVNLLLVSIAMEEIGLSHIINAEAEKIQYVLGTLHGNGTSASIDDILKVNKDVRSTLSEVVRKELLLQMKLETILCSTNPCAGGGTPTHQPCPPDGHPGSGSSYPVYR